MHVASTHRAGQVQIESKDGVKETCGTHNSNDANSNRSTRYVLLMFLVFLVLLPHVFVMAVIVLISIPWLSVLRLPIALLDSVHIAVHIVPDRSGDYIIIPESHQLHTLTAFVVVGSSLAARIEAGLAERTEAGLAERTEVDLAERTEAGLAARTEAGLAAHIEAGLAAARTEVETASMAVHELAQFIRGGLTTQTNRLLHTHK